MTPRELQTIEEIFRAASELEPKEVDTFLEKACHGDEVSRRKITALLASRETAENFLETSAAGLATTVIQRQQSVALDGQLIGHYKLSHPIGTGGMGDVYLATDIWASRKAALKLLPTRFACDPERLQRFQREAQAVTALNHPNILTVYEIGEDGSTYYIASELIEGETLRQLLARRRRGLDEAVQIAIEVASALAAAHDAGIIHRDIKPENIMLRPDGYVKVLDFGIAKFAESVFTEPMMNGTRSMTLAETNLGSILGTVRYMSPEQARGAHVDKTTDIWSLGVVLYEMVAGQAAFGGNTTEEVIAAILSVNPAPLTSYIVHASAQLRQIVSQALRKEQSQRYQSAHELMEALKSFRREIEVAAELKRRATLSRSRPLAASAALIIAVLGAIVVLSFYERRNSTEELPPGKSVAVLPLQNLSEDKEGAFFADGVQDELLSDGRTDRHLWGENYDRTLEDSLSLQGELATDIAEAVGATLSPQEKARVEAPRTKDPAAYDAYLRARAIPVGWGFNAEGDVEGAIRLYEEAVKLDAHFVLAWAYLSIAQIQSIWKGNDSASRLAAAKDSLAHALALDPSLPEVHLARGYQEDNDTRALAEFREAERGFPNSAEVMEAIARRQRALGHWDEAVTELQRAIELDPRDVRACNNLALTYCAMRQFPEALATVERVLAWDPTNARALLTKADALMAIGDLQKAQPLLTNPRIPSDRRAMYALFQRNYAAAVEILSKDFAVEREQRDPENILDLAFSQQLAGELSAARATYQKAIESFRRQLGKVPPGSYLEAITHARLGTGYTGLGEAASAIAEGQKAMDLVPTSENPEFDLELDDEMARIYARLGDADRAIPKLKRLLRTSFGGAPFTTPATLRLDPTWDRIRDDPRFQELTTPQVPGS